MTEMLDPTFTEERGLGHAQAILDRLREAREDVEAFEVALETAREELARKDELTNELAAALDRAADSEIQLGQPTYRAARMYYAGELGRVALEKPMARPQFKRVACLFCGAERLQRESGSRNCAVCGCTAAEAVA